MNAAPAHGLLARRRPGLIVLYALYRLGAAAAIAYPLHRILVVPQVMDFPDGDAILFASGGWYLLDAFRAGSAYFTQAVRAAVTLGVAVGFLSLIPLTTLMVGLNARARLEPRECAAEVVGHLPRFIFLSGTTLLGQAFLAFVFASTLASISTVLKDALAAPTADLIVVGLAILAALAVFTVGVLQDLARAVVVRGRCTLTSAIAIAAGAFLQRPARTLGAWMAWGLSGVATTLLAACVTEWLHVERGGLWRVGLVFLVHQAAVLAVVFCRAGWLASALRLADAALPPEARPDEPSEQPS